MKKKYRIYNLYECVFPAGDHDTLQEAIEDCRWQLFQSLFTDELIIVNTLKDRIVKRFHWEDFNVGGKMYKPFACSRCGSDNTIDIIFGFPTPSTMKKAERGEVWLGGCEVTDNDPLWYCKDCKREFGKINIRTGERDYKWRGKKFQKRRKID